MEVLITTPQSPWHARILPGPEGSHPVKTIQNSGTITSLAIVAAFRAACSHLFPALGACQLPSTIAEIVVAVGLLTAHHNVPQNHNQNLSTTLSITQSKLLILRSRYLSRAVYFVLSPSQQFRQIDILHARSWGVGFLTRIVPPDLDTALPVSRSVQTLPGRAIVASAATLSPSVRATSHQEEL
jgi:hypothetical protein